MGYLPIQIVVQWKQFQAVFMKQHNDFNADKVCNSLRIVVLIDTCAMTR